MAGTKVRGITIELSADASGVGKALQNVNKDINTTAKELKDIDKLLKLDPTNVTLLAQKHEALQRQVTNTREKLDLLKKAEEDLKNEMKDGGTEEQKRQLEALQREIISTEKDLDKYTKQMDEAGDETKDTSQSMEQATGATEKLSGGFTVLKGALANLVADGLRKATEAFKDIMTAAPKYADEIETLAKKTHLETDTLQELSYMSGLVDVELSTVAGSMTKLTKNMNAAKGGTGTAAAAFKTLGVAVTDANGNLRDSEDVFFEAIDALGGIENEAERDATAMALFGKSATELNPMIEAGSDALKGFAAEAHEMGYVLDKDSLESLSKVQDSFDRFQRQMDSVKNQIGAALAPSIERAMQKISDAVSRINWNKVGNEIGKAFNKLIDILEWIIDHGTTVKVVIGAIIAAMAISKVVEFTKAMSGLVDILKKAAAAAAANPYVLLAAAIAACIAAFIAFDQAAWKSYQSTDENWIKTNELTNSLYEQKAAIDDMVDSYNTLNESREKSINAGTNEIAHVQSLYSELTSLADANGQVDEKNRARAEFILGELNTALGTEYTMNGNIISQYSDMVSSIDAVIQKKQAELILQAEEEAYREAIVNRADAERNLEELEESRSKTVAELAEIDAKRNEILSKGSIEASKHQFELSQLSAEETRLQRALNDTNDSYNDARELVGKYTHDITQYENNMVNALEGNYDQIQHKSWETAQAEEKAASSAAKNVAKATTDATRNWGKAFEDSAANIPGGVASGINANIWKATQAAANLAIQATAAFNNNMGIKSPSRVMMKSAKWMVEGVAKGIKQNEGIAVDAVEDFSDDLVAAMNPSASFSGMVSGSGIASVGSAATSEAGILNLLSKYLPELVNRDITLDSGKIVGELAPKYNKQFGRMEALSARGV